MSSVGVKGAESGGKERRFGVHVTQIITFSACRTAAMTSIGDSCRCRSILPKVNRCRSELKASFSLQFLFVTFADEAEETPLRFDSVGVIRLSTVQIPTLLWVSARNI
jgi:hypothetical protein